MARIRGIAHRGFPARYPENTISSFQAALDASFSHMELDVHLSKDGVPVVMHDHTLQRMSNGKGPIKNFTFEQLQQLKVGEAETIPTLEQVFRLAQGRITVLVELKQTGKLYEGLEEKVLEVITGLDMVDQVIITSFDHYALVKMRRLNGDVPIGLLMSGSSPAVFPFMKEISSRYMSIPHAYLTEEYADICHENGVQLITRPIDTEETMNKMLRFPAVLASTNQLERWERFYIEHRDRLQ
ncbi:glycerophosphodiester phosphodiesterase [Paenibacillus allorhizosphaerae]|uniref:Glycerophosphodiester phosphodiesterase n=1 Tax=Paenibacillus allorhizosphaerae TaxID=2849866 RepID=A0ABM8VAL3_9BACL|nr:glycerophosphodiester phosphodiesterase family protein [Paenibacillus allorhizosphaerae]CAG7616813.1 Glycerophosphodiester phosphodiesterase [Paenibacillus allorhizosphaerae]